VKYFIDITLPDGTHKGGTIAWPREDALAVAAEYRHVHPDWVVELVPVDTTHA
jgi:hypothetical protein